MDGTEFAVAALDSAPDIALGPQAVSLALPSSPSDLGMSPQAMVAVFGVSLVLHTWLAIHVQTHDRVPLTNNRRSQVEIQVTRPPPPPKPVEIPPQETRPTPKVAPVAPRRLAAPPPVQTAPASDPGDAPAAAPDPDPAPVSGPPGDGTGEAVAPAAPPPPPPPPAIVQAKEGANYLKNPRPSYPRIAQREGWEGSVLLRVRVLPSGKPGNIAVQKSSGRKILDEAAIDAVTAWTFIPATQGGAAIEGWVTVPIDFRLQ